MIIFNKCEEETRPKRMQIDFFNGKNVRALMTSRLMFGLVSAFLVVLCLFFLVQERN